MERFQDRVPKPPPFLIMDMRPDLNISKAFSGDKHDFLNIIGPQLTEEAGQQKKDSKTFQRELRIGSAALHVANIQNAVDHLSHQQIAQRQQMFTRQNYERVNETDYVNHARALEAGVSSYVASELKKNKSKYNIIEEADEDAIISPHDADMQNGEGLTGSNIFVKEAEGYSKFQQSDLSAFLSTEFQSPLRLLGQENFKGIQNDVSDIQDSANAVTLPDMYSDNKVDSIDVKSNYFDILNNTKLWQGWSDKESFSFLTKMHAGKKGFFKTVRTLSGFAKDQTSIIEREMALRNADNYHQSLSTTFQNTVYALTENVANDVATNEENNRDVFLTQEQAESYTQDIALIEDLWRSIEFSSSGFSVTEQDTLDMLKQQYEDLLTFIPDLATSRENLETESTKHLEQWWSEVGDYLPDGILTPFGLLAEQALDFSEAMSFGLEQDGNLAVQDKMIQDYTAHLDQTVFKPMVSQSLVTAEDLMIDNAEYGLEVMQSLIAQGVMTAEGQVMNFNPEDMTQSFGFSERENTRIYNILKEAYQGEFAFDKLDQTVVNESERQLIKIRDANGETHELNDLISFIDPEASATEQYAEARDKYNVYLDMLLSMSGSNFSDNGELSPAFATNELDDTVTLEVYPHATWQEQEIVSTEMVKIDGEDTIQHTYAWKEVDDAALSMQFEDAQAAQDFYETVRDIVLYLEPIVSTYEPQNSNAVSQFAKHYDENGNVVEGPVRVLVDNAGEYDSSGIISKDSAGFLYDLDYVPQQSFFASQHWNDIQVSLSEKVSFKIGKGIFEKSLLNRFNKKRSDRLQENYKKEKKDWEEEQRQKKIAEAKARATRKKANKKYENAIQKQRNEFKAFMKKAEAERKKREAAKRAEAKKKSQSKGK